MLYQENSLDNGIQNPNLVTEESISSAYKTNSNVQKELEILENLILEGVNVPLTDLVMVDGGVILDRLESLKDNLPTALAISLQILQQKQVIIQQAKNQAQEIVNSARETAERLLQESSLIRKAELEASKIRFEAQQECEQLRQNAYTEIEQWREMATIEYEEIQQDADNYANTVLSDLEVRLSQMLGVVQNGRQHLRPSDDEPENSVNYDG